MLVWLHARHRDLRLRSKTAGSLSAEIYAVVGVKRVHGQVSRQTHAIISLEQVALKPPITGRHTVPRGGVTRDR